jgi:2-polyprenyl-3-methyl-5-hydroxy-6-metoxy-1,4-benzoquinol methylase
MQKNIADIEWTEEKSRRLWDYYARTSTPEDYFSNHSGDHILRALQPWVDFSRGHVLDFGCGPGFLMKKMLASSQGKIYGLDFSENSVQEASARCQGDPHFGGARFTKALPSPFESESMDTVASIEVIEHLLDDALEGMMVEIRRLLKPGGKIVITTPNEEVLENSKIFCPNCDVKFHKWQHIRTWSAASLTQLLKTHGFEPITVQSTYFQPPRASRLNSLKNVVKRLLGRPAYHPRPHLFAVALKRG